MPSGPRPVRLTRAIEFSTSLRYALPGLSAEENRSRFGVKASQHGHNYRLEVTVEGEPDPDNGMVMDLVELKEILEAEVMARFDHRDLNADTPYFEKRLPTPENFALVIRQVLLEALPPGLLARIRLQPDEDHWVEVVEAPVRS
jgi:6-pyruvoyltetrahydropterin/6-carboxytetrahydropterin synthase